MTCMYKIFVKSAKYLFKSADTMAVTHAGYMRKEQNEIKDRMMKPMEKRAKWENGCARR